MLYSKSSTLDGILIGSFRIIRLTQHLPTNPHDYIRVTLSLRLSLHCNLCNNVFEKQRSHNLQWYHFSGPRYKAQLGLLVLFYCPTIFVSYTIRIGQNNCVLMATNLLKSQNYKDSTYPAPNMEHIPHA